MRSLNATLILVMFLAGTAASETALGRDGRGGYSGRGHPGAGHSMGRPSGGHHFHGRHFAGPRFRSGVFIGGPAFWYYPPPRYYYPPYYPQAYVPYAAPFYVERDTAPALTAGYWYYCAEAQAYYPYVGECPGGWQTVAPQPPASP